MNTNEAKLVFPGLAGFYQSWRDVSYTLVRVVVGGIMLTHGWGKVTGAGLAGVSAYMTKQGLEPGAFFAAAAMFIEVIGGICIILGLFTRFFAAAAAIELGIAFLVVHVHQGFKGFEYVLVLGVVMFAIAIRGGGAYSVDRAIGKEL